MNLPLLLSRTTGVAVLISIGFGHLAGGHIAETWSYQQMFEKADVVVIARYVSTRDTGEHTILRDLEPPSKVAGVISEFEVLVALKGEVGAKNLRLHHYRLDDQEYTNGPALLRVAPGRHPTFLLFLTRGRDENYVPVTSQTDAAAFSVLELPGAAF